MDELRGVLKNNDRARSARSMLSRRGYYYDVEVIIMTCRLLFRIISAFLKIITHLKQRTCALNEFICLPFGLSSPLRVFTKVMKPIVAELRGTSIKTVVLVQSCQIA